MWKRAILLAGVALFSWLPRPALLGADHDEQGAGYVLFVDSGVRMRDACEHRRGFANTL